MNTCVGFLWGVFVGFILGGIVIFSIEAIMFMSELNKRAMSAEERDKL